MKSGPVEILNPTMRVQVYIQDNKVEKIYKHTKKVPTIRFGMK